MEKEYTVSHAVPGVRLSGDELLALERLLREAVEALPRGQYQTVREYLACDVGDVKLRPANVDELLRDGEAPRVLNDFYIDVGLSGGSHGARVSLHRWGGRVTVVAGDRRWADHLAVDIRTFLRARRPAISYHLLKPYVVTAAALGLTYWSLVGYLIFLRVNDRPIPAALNTFSDIGMALSVAMVAVSFTVMNPKISPATRIELRGKSGAWWSRPEVLIAVGALTLLVNIALLVVALVK